MKGRLIGIAILVVIVAAALVYQFAIRDNTRRGGLLNSQAELVRGLGSSQQAGLLEDEAVREILRTRYGLQVEYSAAGSIDLAGGEAKGTDFLWPSTQVAVDLYQSRRAMSPGGESIYSTPLVFYTWTEVAAALSEAGYVVENDAGYLQASVAPLLGMVLSGTAWAELGVDDVYGPVAIATADPTRSSSGNLFAGLMANVLDEEGLVSADTLNKVMGRVIRFFDRQGNMESATGVLFDRYLEQGIGLYPIIVGYENQIIEYSRREPEAWAQIQEQVRVIYPLPTAFSENPVIALTEAGQRLVEALRDEEVQAIAWERHGFRTSTDDDPATLGMTGMAARVTQVMRMPAANVMQTITTALQ